MSRNSKINAALQALYDQVPVMIGCTGKCWFSCGPVSMSDHERRRIHQAGYRITPEKQAALQAGVYECEALTGARRCAVYEIRPLMCRLWGTTRATRCPLGCEPEGGWLSDAEAFRLMDQAERIGGHQMQGTPDPQMIAAVSDPEVAALLERAKQGGIQRRALLGNLPPGLRPRETEVPCPECGFMLVIEPGTTLGMCARCWTPLSVKDDRPEA